MSEWKYKGGQIRGYDQLGNRRKPKPVIGLSEALIIFGLVFVGVIAMLEAWA